MDQTVHRLAFATARLQFDLADLEDRLFKRELAGIHVKQPVFITALPRAGTTVLLDVYAATNDFACHTYRDMPFVLLPLLWDRLSRRHRKEQAAMERAHGDGLTVSPDSAEAFEEMLWMAGSPRNYKADRVIPWTGVPDPEFARTFVNHLKKVILLRQKGAAKQPRYVSKNNGNIARIGILPAICPGAVIIVPVREPVQHAASLLQQHIRFLEIHRRDSFGRAYMRGIGHLEFGDNLRPIDFDGWLANARHRDARRLEFWLEYWIAAYSHMLMRHSQIVRFFAYDAFCERPADGLRRLARFVDAPSADAFVAQAATIHAPRRHDVPVAGVDGDLLARAQALYREVLAAT